MAVTHGHGNPNWTKEETALALQLLLKRNMKLPASDEDPDSLELSQLLQSLEIHPLELRKNAFRNGASVSFKMGNLRNVATGQGLKNTSKTDKLVWEEFGNNPEALDDYCDLVRATSNRISELPDDASEDDDDELPF